jgi:DNA-binding transcriptional ArsR family regulator
MGISKTSGFTASQNHLAQLFKALGHPARVAIVEHLLKINSCICGDLVQELPLAQATISQHLKELKAANIIQGSIEGNTLCYCLNPETIAFEA